MDSSADIRKELELFLQTNHPDWQLTFIHPRLIVERKSDKDARKQVQRS